MLIGRENEQKLLLDSMKSDKSSFIAIYGRRRIGKTDLVNQTFRTFTFKHTGIYGGDQKTQLQAFSNSLEYYGTGKVKKLHNWIDAFFQLQLLIEKSSEKKKVIFIDELSWMDYVRSDLISAVEHFWNNFCFARNDVILIVCCSATSWMLSKVINNKGGLYNRLTDRIHLHQFSLYECKQFVLNNALSLNDEQILQYYMVFGGVPYYWTFLVKHKGKSIAQIIDILLFYKDAELKNEYEYLFKSIFKYPDLYIKIVESLGTKKAGMTRNEIIEESGIGNTGDLTQKLEELESCGFIRKYYPIGAIKKNAIYQLMDNFVLFYFQFINRKLVTDEHFWLNQVNTSKINTWQGLAFERVCLLHVNQIKRKLGVYGVISENYSLVCKKDVDKGIVGSQIDLIIQRKDQVINLCEMKYYSSDYSIDEKTEKQLRNKINDLIIISKTKYSIHPTLVTTYGLVDNTYSGIIQNVIVLRDLFEKVED